MKIKVYQVDAFTKTPFKGNPAGVVVNADGLNEDQMQRIARELNNSETAFLFSPEANDHDVMIRYFTPTVEVPSCGHATVASHYVRAIEDNLEPGPFNHKIKIGVLPVDITKEEGDYKIMMTQGKPEFLDVLSEDQKARALEGLSLSKDDLVESLPIQIVDTGHSKVMVPMKSWEKLQQIEIKESILANISKEIKCNGFYVFTLDSQQEGILAHGRMFAPAIGIKEDPVTGNANGPLGAYLIKYNLVEHDGSHFSFKALQGEKIGRAGAAHVEVFIENNEPVKVKVGGNAKIVFQTEIEI